MEERKLKHGENPLRLGGEESIGGESLGERESLGKS